MKGKEPSTINSDELEDLGYLVSGLTSEEISQIKNDVFIDAMATLGDIDSLDSETTTALAEKAVEAYGYVFLILTLDVEFLLEKNPLMWRA